MWNKRIKLISKKTINGDKYGEKKELIESLECFANISDVGMNQYYQASMNNLTLNFRARVRASAFNQFKFNFVEYNGEQYNIVRVYKFADYVDLDLGSYYD